MKITRDGSDCSHITDFMFDWLTFSIYLLLSLARWSEDQVDSINKVANNYSSISFMNIIAAIFVKITYYATWMT